jgi:hypothetical protein
VSACGCERFYIFFSLHYFINLSQHFSDDTVPLKDLVYYISGQVGSESVWERFSKTLNQHFSDDTVPLKNLREV